LQRSSKVILGYGSQPLLNDGPVTVQQQDMGLISETQLTFESIIGRIVDIQIDKIDLSAILSLQSMHDGRHTPAGRSPESEKFYQLGLAGSQGDR
jgi:hypothetical protein